MEISNNIGSANWKNLTGVQGVPTQKPAVAPNATPVEVPAVAGDRIELSPMPYAPAAPSAPAPAPVAQTQPAPSFVPTSLLADDASMNLIGSASSASTSHPTSTLGVLAQLDETSAVRAVDNASSTNRFADLNLVGVSNAGQYLANPEAMYLGV